MQGIMIQEYTKAPETGSQPVVSGQKELQDQPFGRVLGGATDKAAQKGSQGRRDVMAQKVSKQDVPVAETAEATPDQAATATPDQVATATPGQVATAAPDQVATATPFFMAALFDQSAAQVQPSQNAERVATAERIQELIGQWLQVQNGEDGADGESAIQLGAQPEVAELMTAALDVLGQSNDDQSDEPDNLEVARKTLNAVELEELRKLVAVMLQGGQGAQVMPAHPQVSEPTQQLNSVLPFVPDKMGSKDQQVLNEHAKDHAKKVDETEVVAADSKMGLQEEQIAKLLKPRHEQPTLHEIHADKTPQLEAETIAVVPQVDASDAAVPEMDVEMVKSETLLKVEQSPQYHQAQTAAVIKPLEAQATTGAPRLMQLPSGQQIVESQLVDQVVTHLAGSNDGEYGRMRLRLHPAELGSLRLDLIVEGDKVRAHLQAQSQHVQQVLDRHLPQLRDALQQQGLKIDEFRVDVQTDQQESSGQKFAWQQQQQQHQGHSAQSPWLADEWQQELEIPLEQLLQQNTGGISLRV